MPSERIWTALTRSGGIAERMPWSVAAAGGPASRASR